MNWHDVFEPLRTGFNEMFVTYFRDPSLVLALALTVPGLLFGVLNAVWPGRRLLKWSLGRLVGLSSFFGVIGLALCVLPHDRGLFFTRTQALIAAGLVVVSWTFVIVLHKLTRSKE